MLLTFSWEQRKVGDFLVLSKIPGHTGIEAKKLTVKLWGKGVVEKNDIFNGSENTQYYVRRAGQFMYGKLDFLHAAFGIVPEKLDNYESTLDLPAFDLKGIDSQFLLERVTQEDFYLRNGLVANGSRKAKRIHEETFLNMDLIIPSYKEQTQIGDLFRLINDLITVQQRKSVSKDEVMNLFLCKSNALVDVDVYANSWEQRRLGEVIEGLYNGQTPSRFNKDNWNGSINWLSSGELNRSIVVKTVEKISSKGKSVANLKVIPKGTVVIAITGLEAAGTRGNCAKLGIDTTLNQSCMAIFPKREILDSDYLFHWYKKIGESYGIRYTQGTKQQSYNAEIIKILPITLPKIEEQQVIARFLDDVDHQITVQQRM